MNPAFITKLQNNKRKLLRSFLSLVLVILLVIVALLAPIVQDIYPVSLTNIHPYTILRPYLSFHPETNRYEIILGSEVFISTNSTYPQVESWYTQNGWDCWGLCQNGVKYNIGKFTFSTFKNMGEFKMASSENTKNSPLIIKLSESYWISYFGDE